MGDEKSPVNIDVSAGAKLNVDVKTEIPKESSGRFLDALTDAIRPFTEKRGLKADQIRLQREDVMVEIARKAQQRLAMENVSPKAIPARILIPILEKASLADANSNELKAAWANLIASASRDGENGIAIYTDMLSKLDPIHVKFLEDFGRGADGYTSDFFLFLEEEKIDEIITHEYRSLPANLPEEETAKAFDKSISDYFRFGGAAIVAGGIGPIDVRNRYPNTKYGSEIYYALEALSIITVENARGKFSASADHVWLKMIRFTPFGFDLFQACSETEFSRTKEEIKMIDTISAL